MAESRIQTKRSGNQVGRKQKRSFKIILIGDKNVGKTCFSIRFCSGNFVDTISTIGVDFRSKSLYINGEEVEFQLFDTAGQETHRAMTHNYYRRAEAVIIMYDVTDRKTFQNIPGWMEEINRHNLDEVPRILVGNKNDCQEKQVEIRVAQKLAAHYNIPFFST